MAARKVVNIGIQHGGDGDVRVASGAIVGGTVNVLSPGSAASPDSGAARAAFREKLDAEDKAVAAAAGRHRDLIGDAKVLRVCACGWCVLAPPACADI
jgi:hypothetical protein